MIFGEHKRGPDGRGLYSLVICFLSINDDDFQYYYVFFIVELFTGIAAK